MLNIVPAQARTFSCVRHATSSRPVAAHAMAQMPSLRVDFTRHRLAYARQDAALGAVLKREVKQLIQALIPASVRANPKAIRAVAVPDAWKARVRGEVVAVLRQTWAVGQASARSELRKAAPGRFTFNPDQLRDQTGKWAGSGLRTSDQIKSVGDLRSFADVSLPKDTATYEFYYHATRSSGEFESILKQGVIPGPRNQMTYLSKHEIRDRGAGFVIVRVPVGSAKGSLDRLESNITYHQWTVDKQIPASDVVRGVRFVQYEGGGGHGINESDLAGFAVEHQGYQDMSGLPAKYHGWFRMGTGKFDLSPSTLPEYIDTLAYNLTESLGSDVVEKLRPIWAQALAQDWSSSMLSDKLLEALSGYVDTSGQDITPARIATIVRTTDTNAYNLARKEVFEDPALNGFVEAYEYSAILDDRTTALCEELDGKVYPVDDPFWDEFTPPNHFNCRSLLIPVVQGDEWAASKPVGEDVQPQAGFHLEPDAA